MAASAVDLAQAMAPIGCGGRTLALQDGRQAVDAPEAEACLTQGLGQIFGSEPGGVSQVGLQFFLRLHQLLQQRCQLYGLFVAQVLAAGALALSGGLGIGADLEVAIANESFLPLARHAGWPDQRGAAMRHLHLTGNAGIGDGAAGCAAALPVGRKCAPPGRDAGRWHWS